MTEARRIQLHLGKCIDDLDKLYNVPDLKTKRASVLCKTAQKLFEKAEEYRQKGDEEYSYVYFMKYLRVVAYLSTDKDYLKDKAYFNNMLGAKNPNKAIDAAEQLKTSLIHRYDLEQQADKMELEAVDLSMGGREPGAVGTQVPLPAPNFVLPDPDEVMIRSEQLFPLLRSGNLRVMILDTRSNADYQESHVKHHTCISVPEECIRPGQSANVLEQGLPEESREAWSKRSEMDLIVMLDWSSTTIIAGKPLFLLKTILLKWDVKVRYDRPPLVLWGGFEDWLLKYPARTTNPQVLPPGQAGMVIDILGGIDYPTWVEMGPPAAAAPPRPFKPSEPYVDRSSKAAAVQVYEERARQMQQILEQQEVLADTSLTLEMQRIEAEQDWERVRGQREMEEKDDQRAMYKLREQEIISQLMQLENKQFDMEQENQLLREKLEEYQRKEKEEAERLAATLAAAQAGQEEGGPASRTRRAAAALDVAAKRARIAAVTEQRDQLDRRREGMELERKRRLAEARDKRKPDGDRDEDGDIHMSSPDDSPNFNRSYSSPNIAKACSDEEEAAAPAFDRSTKPNKSHLSALRPRDFEPIFGKVGRGLTGLQNLGNTCYMNSIVQCLSNTSVLVSYFCGGQYLDHLNRRAHTTRGCIAEELAAVVRALWSGQYRYIATKDLRHEIGRHQRSFRGCQQQDSHEFLTILMDWLHLDLQFTIKPELKESPTPSEKAWHEYTKSKESLILRLFYGQIKSTVQCTVCAMQSVTYESFSNLSLELPTNATRCTLGDCLRLYLNDETIAGWNCPNCKEKRNAVKKLDISRLPPVLVIHFKRFFVVARERAANPEYRKKQTYIEFPVTGFDIRQYCAQGPSYELYAVSNHYGSMESGHYTAYCKSTEYGKWYKFDDHAVVEMSAREVNSSAAYILFYTSCRTA